MILSYLWGIETLSKVKKKLTTSEKDFILPMRNWNYINGDYKQSDDKDFILPMRNWNFIKM